ncbi:Chitin bind 4 domain containing protein [Asbolus verrucosus]|uniref:Chitin bind 4 domain containing protein n=1 Tax=Asbolus verrucosus TaxID=1661398 RepID=A0A482W130_ASBVE|nr:Chitin bind 4 domain containing protein [Asbolus verrucosus]
MASKFLILAVALAVARAGLVQHATSALFTVPPHPVVTAQAIVPVLQTRVEPFDLHPRYSYAYAVNDQQTGDFKSQHESRDGNVVHGRYSVADPDGSLRTVDYSAGPHTGFNAVVHRTVGAHPIAPTPTVIPVHVAAGH